MKKRFFPRILSMLICLCLLPLAAQTESSTYIPLDSQAIHSEINLRLGLRADGFPGDVTGMKAWEEFLQKLSLKGALDTIDFGKPINRIYFNGGLYVNDVVRIPFIYDGYHSYRYLVSPAFRNESIHFQMHNFFQFMYKLYYYTDLPTQHIALLLYPEAAYYVWDSYYGSLHDALDSKETRTVSIESLRALCQQMNRYVTDDTYYDRVSFFFTCLLTDMSAAESVLVFLSSLEDYLDDLDPRMEGMTVSVEEGRMAFVLGGRTLYEEECGEDGSFAFTLALPGKEEQELTCVYRWEPSAGGALLLAELAVIQDGESLLSILVNIEGLPWNGDTQGTGRASLAIGGTGLEESFPPLDFVFQWKKDHAELPHCFNLDVDWLHPVTGKPALFLHYDAAVTETDHGVFVEKAYPQEDFFSLNEGSMAEYQERYLPTLALSLTPVVLEMPTAVLGDIIEFAVYTGLWESMGIPEILESPGVMELLELLGIAAPFQELGADQTED
ncbi:MAG: hypothetical protein FWF86_01060 [Clostridia bacterium]|nr:hypothetical protein [Clostridia bacterium]